MRNTYRSASKVGLDHARAQAEMEGWNPVEPFITDYLNDLLSDVRRNLREFKKTKREDADVRRLVLRAQLSARVAAQRGFTDALVSAYAELSRMGFRVRKVWTANFVDNDPCSHCRTLHGTEVALEESFPADASLSVYGNLYGPPRHPRCRCFLVMLIVTLDNVLTVYKPDEPTPATAMISTEEVRRMPNKAFAAVTKALSAIIRFFRKGKKNG